jgi:hypothetical protein
MIYWEEIDILLPHSLEIETENEIQVRTLSLKQVSCEM